jgi:hypothetical protein
MRGKTLPVGEIGESRKTSPTTLFSLPPSQALGGGPKKRGRQAQLGISTPFRQLRQLAERVEFPRKRPLFANFGPHLAEWVKFPEKNAGFWLPRV